MNEMTKVIGGVVGAAAAAGAVTLSGVLIRILAMAM